MVSDAKTLKRTLRNFGLSDPAIAAAWPEWWSDAAEASPSACTELRFSIARKLGLDPKSLSIDDRPKFVWKDFAKFKHLSNENEMQRRALISYGNTIGRSLISATAPSGAVTGINAVSLRESILSHQPFIRLVDLLATCWALGVPVVHLRVFPLSAKRMCAMAIKAGERYAILLSKDSQYPAPIAYYVAHELGHIMLNHFGDTPAVIDFKDPLKATDDDEEENAADKFALTLLTGRPEPRVEISARKVTARGLASTILAAAVDSKIEPGTMALCFGYSTGNWPIANAAMSHIYTEKRQVWIEVNKLATKELHWDVMSDDIALFVRAVMGGDLSGKGRT